MIQPSLQGAKDVGRFSCIDFINEIRAIRVNPNTEWIKNTEYNLTSKLYPDMKNMYQVVLLPVHVRRLSNRMRSVREFHLFAKGENLISISFEDFQIRLINKNIIFW